MRALVISGGGSKGAFAGGVAQYLIQEEGKKYDLFLGTSTGSLLIPHLAMGNIDKVYDIYTNVNQRKIFNVNPFVVKRKEGREYVTINYFNMFWQFVRKKRTFGESQAIKRGATEVDAIILEAENMEYNKVLGKNPFSLMINLFGFLLDQVEYHDIVEGKLAALNKKVKLNTYYTPTKLTENSLVFNKKLMGEWWQQGYDHAKEKHLQYLATKRKGFFGLF